MYIFIFIACNLYVLLYYSYTVQPSIVEDPVMIQAVYPGMMVNFSCRAEGFSMLNYSWFIVTAGADTGREIMDETDTVYIIANPTYTNHNATGYYCIASNNEGIAVSNTSTLIGNKSSIKIMLLIEFK